MAIKCSIQWSLRINWSIFFKFGIKRLSSMSIEMAMSKLTLSPIWLSFWPTFEPMRTWCRICMKFGLQMFSMLLIQMAKPDFISVLIRPPFWPHYWHLRTKCHISWNLIYRFSKTCLCKWQSWIWEMIQHGCHFSLIIEILEFHLFIRCRIFIKLVIKISCNLTKPAHNF